MAKVQPLLKSLSKGLIFLGLLIVILSFMSFWTQRGTVAGGSTEVDTQLQGLTDRRIERLQVRLRLLPYDHVAYTKLGGAYLQKTRETGDPSYLTKAEESLKRALELAPGGSKTMTLMGAVELSRHQFQEALGWARASLIANALNPAAYGVLGDAQLELGQYEDAFRSYQAMVDLKPNLQSYARVSLARKLVGDTDGAIGAMRAAVSDGPPKTESLAWAQVQLGDLLFHSGRSDKAEQHYEAALLEFDNYYLALARLGRVRAHQGRTDEAIQLYRKSIAIIPQPSVLAELGDLYTALGEHEKAEAQYETVELIGRLSAINKQIYNRELVMFYSDHNLMAEKALESAVRELVIRKDIYGYDAVAWALYRSSRPAEAAEAMDQALSLGTQDATLYFHSGMIHYQLGNRDRARQHLSHALALNPNFSILHGPVARRTLQELSE